MELEEVFFGMGAIRTLSDGFVACIGRMPTSLEIDKMIDKLDCSLFIWDEQQLEDYITGICQSIAEEAEDF